MVVFHPRLIFLRQSNIKSLLLMNSADSRIAAKPSAKGVQHVLNLKMQALFRRNIATAK